MEKFEEIIHEATYIMSPVYSDEKLELSVNVVVEALVLFNARLLMFTVPYSWRGIIWVSRECSLLRREAVGSFMQAAISDEPLDLWGFVPGEILPSKRSQVFFLEAMISVCFKLRAMAMDWAPVIGERAAKEMARIGWERGWAKGSRRPKLHAPKPMTEAVWREILRDWYSVRERGYMQMEASTTPLELLLQETDEAEEPQSPFSMPVPLSSNLYIILLEVAIENPELAIQLREHFWSAGAPDGKTLTETKDAVPSDGPLEVASSVYSAAVWFFASKHESLMSRIYSKYARILLEDMKKLSEGGAANYTTDDVDIAIQAASYVNFEFHPDAVPALVQATRKENEWSFGGVVHAQNKDLRIPFVYSGSKTHRIQPTALVADEAKV